jgi:hypothetical protein
METMATFKLWICLAAIGCVLCTVTTLSIRAGPSASSAITAIRVAHLELFWAKVGFRDPGIHEAEFRLNEAWSTLQDRRYAESVSAAHEALQRVRDIKREHPSFYSRYDSDELSESLVFLPQYCPKAHESKDCEFFKDNERGGYGKHTMALDAGGFHPESAGYESAARLNRGGGPTPPPGTRLQ